MSVVFTDVPADSPFGDAIASAVDLGIMSGYSDGTFRPDEGMVGQDFGVMLGRAMAGPTVSSGTLSAILENPVLQQEADGPIDRLRAVIAVVNAIDEARPGLIPDLPGILEHLRALAGDTREFPRARDAGLLTVLLDSWSDRVGLGESEVTELRRPAHPDSGGLLSRRPPRPGLFLEFMDEPLPRAEMAQLLVNVVHLLLGDQARN